MEAPQASLPHIPPRGCRPLDPCFAQLLNGPERVASRQVTPCGPTSALWRVRAGKIMQSPGARSIFLVLSGRSEEHTSELQSHSDLVCRLLLEKKKKNGQSEGLRPGRPPRTR